MVPPDADTFARAYLDTLIQRRYDRVAARLLPGMPDTGTTATLRSIRDELPDVPKRPILVGLEQAQFDSVTAIVLVYEVQGYRMYALVLVALARELGLCYLSVLRAMRTSAPLSQINAFTFAGKGPAHFIVAAVAVIALVFSVFTAFYVLDSRMPRRWLWAPLALIGTSQVVFDWTSGAVAFSWFAVRVPVLAAGRLGPAGPWLVVIALPVFALVAFERARRYRRARTTTPAFVPPVEEDPPAA
jgi:hypothetical protein